MVLLLRIALVLACTSTLTFAQFTFTTAKPATSPTCPNNTNSKAAPSKEPNLHACKSYSCNSCCGETITADLAMVPLHQVGALNFQQCKDPLSDACSMASTYMECFYQCSPNLYPWMGPFGKLSSVPVCASFCDRWLTACMSDQTCVAGAGNWKIGLKRGFDDNNNPVDPCIGGVSCRNYSEVYGTAENLCNTIWGDLFQYSTDENNCLDPSNPSKNAKMVGQMDSQYSVSDCVSTQVVYTDAGLIVGIVFGVLAGLFLIAAGVAFYMRQKKEKDDDSVRPKPKETGPAEELATLKSAKPDPEAPPNTADGSDIEEA